jgi:hypothetical protein
VPLLSDRGRFRYLLSTPILVGATSTRGEEAFLSKRVVTEHCAEFGDIKEKRNPPTLVQIQSRGIPS